MSGQTAYLGLDLGTTKIAAIAWAPQGDEVLVRRLAASLCRPVALARHLEESALGAAKNAAAGLRAADGSKETEI